MLSCPELNKCIVLPYRGKNNIVATVDGLCQGKVDKFISTFFLTKFIDFLLDLGDEIGMIGAGDLKFIVDPGKSQMLFFKIFEIEISFGFIKYRTEENEDFVKNWF